MLLLLLLQFLALLAGSTNSGCSYEAVAELRSKVVQENYDPALMTGLWYEHIYIDPAQIGASCQTLNVTFDAGTNTLNTDFSVLYGSQPFTIVEHYAPEDSSKKGVYKKYVDIPFGIPGGSLVTLPTAVVIAELSPDGSRYDSMVLSSCYSLLVTTIEELVVFSRKPSMDEQRLRALLKAVREQGGNFREADLQHVDHSKCPSMAAAHDVQGAAGILFQ
eukprot:CAMPEP_0172727796 /NCGR_PEP_ID=MMETSP1074-20121228/91877_1 /TAXON_ID=2916 /ORGANISM="Ceratium fusus, Strain PA161109" /LENGTH=218 /DNA_ID=CAMNT_0013554977 /DNA_START=42 /DNA_END=698 /DNA_ORIENTATION=-